MSNVYEIKEITIDPSEPNSPPIIKEEDVLLEGEDIDRNEFFDNFDQTNYEYQNNDDDNNESLLSDDFNGKEHFSLEKLNDVIEEFKGKKKKKSNPNIKPTVVSVKPAVYNANDQTSQINKIEDQIKIDPSKLNDQEIVTYLRFKSTNKYLNPNNYDSTVAYLNKVSISYSLQNLISNNTSYSSLAIGLVLLLVPFFYNYPNFYTADYKSLLFGLFGLITILTNLNNYSKFSKIDIPNKWLFQQLALKLIIISFLFYVGFFVMTCRLNHYCFFFMSIAIVYLFMTWVLKLVLMTPGGTKISKYRASYQKNDAAAKFNDNISKACDQLNKRFKLNLPNPELVYNYIAYFKIGSVNTNITDFISTLFQYPLTLLFLYILGKYFNNITVEDYNFMKGIPIIGYNDDTFKFIQCQANYILPEKLNYDNLINKILEKLDEKKVEFMKNKSFGKNDLEPTSTSEPNPLLENCISEISINKFKKLLNILGQYFIDSYKPTFFYSNGPDGNKNLNMIYDENAKKIIDQFTMNLNTRTLNEISNTNNNNNQNTPTNYELGNNPFKNNNEEIKIKEEIITQTGGNVIGENIIKNLGNNSKSPLKNKNKNTNQILHILGNETQSPLENKNINETIHMLGNENLSPLKQKEEINIKERIKTNFDPNLNLSEKTKIFLRDSANTKLGIAVKEFLTDSEIKIHEKNEFINSIIEFINQMKIIFDNKGVLPKEEENSINQEIRKDLKHDENIHVTTFEDYKTNIIGKENNDNKGINILQTIICIVSSWMIVGKPLGSTWVFSKYITSNFIGYDSIIETIRRDWSIWRFVSMGLDRISILENTKNIENLDINPSGIVISIIVMIFLFPFFTIFQNTVFGYNFAPKIYNFIWVILIIINLVINIQKLIKKENTLYFNIIYYTIIIILMTVFIIYAKKIFKF